MTYELINRRTSNTFGDYGSEREALEAYERVQTEDPQLADEFLIVEFDANGEAVASRTPSELYAI